MPFAIAPEIKKRENRSAVRGLTVYLGWMILTSCATGLDPSGLRINTDYLPEGSSRLAEVIALATRAEIVESKPVYEAILSSGISDSDIKDGSVVLARIYCCGGPNEKDTARMLFVPRPFSVKSGDIVEVRSGRPPASGNSGRLNTVTQVRQKGSDKSTCRWVPPDARLWTRVLYCDWMPADGWIEQQGLFKAWFRPAN